MSDITNAVAAICLLLALSGCTQNQDTRVLPEYTPGEVKCLGEAEINADASLLLCAKKHKTAICPKEPSDKIEATQREEVTKCLDQY